jgi:hypothetical protein
MVIGWKLQLRETSRLPQLFSHAAIERRQNRQATLCSPPLAEVMVRKKCF